ncbi:tumor necrosis factor receptor superfamily member 13B isoform X2 [Esox lucius]|uniref:tumor necrosis factor receptor superfamily member 13B isoform X2 n=1 Tax=Esox lucius TaxID=8010 RepID=UPI0005769009|nr:tumor necrosis factor receptor superfamily member 13B isoform X2 [Esox lucius]
MGLGCPEGHFWDGLVRVCVTCQMVCQQPHQHYRCTEYCVSQRCKADPGQFYDRLLKKCMRCAVVCGSHPSECEDQCQTQLPALTPTLRITDESVLQKTNTRGGSLPKGLPNSAIMVYSALGLCLALLLLTMSGAMLVLLRARRRGPQPGATRRKQTQGHGDQPEGQQPNKHSQSSEASSVPSLDCLPGQSLPRGNHVTAAGRSSCPTETCVCVHCFPDLRVPGRWEKQHKPPLTIYHQAVPQALCTPTTPPHCGASPKIICSPSQPSFSDGSPTETH